MVSGGDAEYSELEVQRKWAIHVDKICCSFFDEEKSAPNFLESKNLRQEVATVSQVSEDVVMDMYEKYK